MIHGRLRRRASTLSITGLASITLVAGLAAAASLASAQENQPADSGEAEAEVQPQLREELAAEGETVFWVYMREQADLSAASGIADRAAQGEYVYERLTETAEDSQARLVELLDAEGVDYESFWIANTVKVTGDEDLLEQVAALPEVEQITADEVYELPEPIPGEDQPSVNSVEWGIADINAPQVWNTFGTRGEGIVVGTIDSGAMFSHEALVGQYRGNLGNGEFDHDYNWHDPSEVCGSPSLEPCDNSGHGSHVVGTIAGDDGGDNQIGVAPGVTWIAAKGCETRFCSQDALLSSGQFMLAPTDLNGENADPSLRPHIVNNSWGGPADDDPWYRQTVQNWVDAGIFPMFANGNTPTGVAPCGSASNPANLPESYSTGAFDINHNLANFSNRGFSAWGDDLIKPDIAAPGVDIRSAWNDGGYNTIDGTSMASPHVAGTVALMWSAAPALVRDVETTRELLNQTAIDTEDLTCGGTPENNNMFGEGRLDAFAAVEASPRGPVGTLAGTVTDADSGEPIGGATVSAAGEFDRTVTTAADGTYSIVLPAGDYDVTVSAFGYEAATVPVTVTADQTTTQDFPLQPVDSVTVSGQVTDGSGHGWPLYAHINVADTPVSTFTDPFTGEYTLTLPANDTYTLEVRPQYPGYADVTETVDVGDSDVVRDLQLIVDDCLAAPGYELSTSPELSESFDAEVRPDGWTVVDNIGNDQVWAFDNPDGRDNETGGEGGFAIADSDFFGSGTNQDTELITPVIDLSDVSTPVLQFNQDFNWFTGGLDEFSNVDVSVDGGQSWETVLHQSGGDVRGPRQETIELPQAGGESQVQLRFHYGNASFEFWWQIDNVNVVACVPTDGGLVLGTVDDANTGERVNGATVTSVGAPEDTGTSSATPDDPALGDGFYWLFSSLTGDQEFTAAASGYMDNTRTVPVTASAANRADFTLPAGRLTVDPTQLDATQVLGESADHTVTITNTGTAPAEVELVERAGGYEPLGSADAAAQPTTPPTEDGSGAEVNRIEIDATLDVLTGAAGLEELAREPAAGPGPVASQEPAAEPWIDLPEYPVAIADNGVAVVDGSVYSFGGFSSGGGVSSVYEFDIEQQTWNQLGDMPGASRQQAAVGVIDGLVYVVSGWGDLDTTTLIYDPASDSWSTGADALAGRSAAGTAVLGGQLYVVGGCTTSTCSPYADDVFRYDPADDTWETLADYPEPTAWQSCGAINSRLYCAGGTTDAGASTSTYEYDPQNDVWLERADMPFDLWGGAYAGANGELLIASGVTGNSTVITNEGLAYDPEADAWRDLPPANNAFLRSGSACGLYKVGGADLGFFGLIPQEPVELLPGFEDCAAAADIPWLEADPTTTTVPAGESVSVTMTLDAAVEQPGLYTGSVAVGHDTPYDVPAVDVTMDVTPPNDWGRLTGVVTSVDCEGNESPLPGAIVQIEGNNDLAVRLTTDANGRYAWWTASNNNRLTMIVGAVEHQPQTDRARIIPKQTVEEDYALQAVCSTPGGDLPVPNADTGGSGTGGTAIHDGVETIGIADVTTVQNAAQQTDGGVTVSGQVTDGSGHGWPLYARIDVEGESISTFTDPATGEYSLTLPAGATYTLAVESQYPGYTDATETVDVAEQDITVDLQLVVDACQAAGYTPGVAVVTTSPSQGFDDYFAERGIGVDFYPGDEIDQLAARASDYSVVVYSYNSSSGEPTQEQFDTFLSATDAAGTGVIFLDHAFTTWNGIRALSNLTGNPASTDSSTSGSSGEENLYEVVQEHPILDGFEVGDQIIHEPGQSAWLAWFDGYEGEGRQVIADAGRTEDGIFGSGIGVQERANNRHVLMSIHSSSASRSPDEWSADSVQIFQNALEWSAKGASLECGTIDGALVVGEVADLNTGAGVSGATVSSQADPGISGTSFATPDDPALGDGFYWLFSSLTGSQEFTASADNFVDGTQAVDVVASSANEANFSLAAGRIAVDPAQLEATMEMGQSADRTFTVTNTGTAAAEVDLTERSGDLAVGDLRVAMVTTDPDQGFDDYFADREIAVDFYGGAQLDQLAADVSNYSVVVYGYNDSGGEPTQEQFDAFLDATDAAGVGVIFLDHAFTTWNGIRALSAFTGNPATTSRTTGGADQDNFYEVTQEHPILAGFDVGQRITHEPGELGWLAWFDGYEGDGRQVIAGAGRAADGVLGSGIGVQERPNNRHVLLSIHSASGTRSPANWSADSEQIFQNSLAWVTQADLSWLSIEPATATLAPGESVTVTASLTAEVAQPGVYTAAINVGSDTPYPPDQVGVTMNVTAPNTWGEITGTVTTVDCDGVDGPLADVVIQLNGKSESVTLTTGGDGGYGWWLASRNNPLTLIVWDPDHWAQTRQVTVTPKTSKAEDFALQAVCPGGGDGP